MKHPEGRTPSFPCENSARLACMPVRCAPPAAILFCPDRMCGSFCLTGFANDTTSLLMPATSTPSSARNALHEAMAAREVHSAATTN